MKLTGKVCFNTRSNVKPFGNVVFYPLGPESIFYFVDPCLLANYEETGAQIFMIFSWYVRHDTKNNWLDCFTACTLGSAVDSRLFHSSQTRRGGGLYSRGVSCWLSVVQNSVRNTWRTLYHNNIGIGPTYLTHWVHVTQICVSELGHLWFRSCLVASAAPSHNLNQCWYIVNWTLRNKLQRNCNQNTNFSFVKTQLNYRLRNGGKFVQREMSWQRFPNMASGWLAAQPPFDWNYFQNIVDNNHRF